LGEGRGIGGLIIIYSEVGKGQFEAEPSDNTNPLTLLGCLGLADDGLAHCVAPGLRKNAADGKD